MRANANSPPGSGGAPSISILCVEDDAISREFLAKILAMKFPGHRIHTAENGQAGLELFRKIHPEVVLTDISMPVMDGIELAREIRRLDPGAHIIALSAHSSLEHRSEEVAELFTRYLLKPVKGDQLGAAIDECLSRIGPGRGHETS